MQLGPDLIAVGMVDLVEDAQGPGPDGASRGGVARAAVGLAEVIERVGLVEPVPQLPVQVNGPRIARDGPRTRAGEFSQMRTKVASYSFAIRVSIEP